MGLPEKRKRPAGENGAPQDRCGGDAPTVAAVVDNLSHLQRRVIQDAVNTARREWWLRRAEDFERAKPRPNEHHGRASRAELSAAWQRCHDTANACRNQAALIELAAEEYDAEIAVILDLEGAA